MTDIITPVTETGDEEIVPDYSRLGFRDLRKLCTARGIPADGNVPALIEKLKAYDAQHGKDVDITVPDVEDDDDPLGLDDETPDGAGEAASASAPSGHTGRAAQPQTPEVGADVPAGTPPFSPAPGSPATHLQADPDAPKVKRGRADLSTRNGVVPLGGDDKQKPQRVFRAEYVIGDRDVTDADHFRFIADTHALAAQAGEQSRGGATIGERVGYATDAHGQRTVIYQVILKRS